MCHNIRKMKYITKTLCKDIEDIILKYAYNIWDVVRIMDDHEASKIIERMLYTNLDVDYLFEHAVYYRKIGTAKLILKYKQLDVSAKAYLEFVKLLNKYDINTVRYVDPPQNGLRNTISGKLFDEARELVKSEKFTLTNMMEEIIAIRKNLE